MLDAAYHRPFDLCPVDAVVQLLVHQPYGAHVVAAHNVDAQGIDCRRFGVVWRPDDSFDSIAEYLDARGLAMPLCLSTASTTRSQALCANRLVTLDLSVCVPSSTY